LGSLEATVMVTVVKPVSSIMIWEYHVHHSGICHIVRVEVRENRLYTFYRVSPDAHIALDSNIWDDIKEEIKSHLSENG
jgi:hypothetical protein